jgi:hypothetical protein
MMVIYDVEAALGADHGGNDMASKQFGSLVFVGIPPLAALYRDLPEPACHLGWSEVRNRDAYRQGFGHNEIL